MSELGSRMSTMIGGASPRNLLAGPVKSRTVGGVEPRGAIAGLIVQVMLAVACASSSGPQQCRVEVTGLEEYDARAGDLRVAYQVKGVAGSPGKVWLAARTAEKTWISGGAQEVGPGGFAAVVDLRLTGRAAEYKVVLEVAGKRCADDAPVPKG